MKNTVVAVYSRICSNTQCRITMYCESNNYGQIQSSKKCPACKELGIPVTSDSVAGKVSNEIANAYLKTS
jgi:hypothetical protein